MIKFAEIIDFFYIGKKRFSHILWSLVEPLYAKVLIALAVLTNAANWYFAYLISSNITAERTILHYNVDFGINLIGSENQLYIIPLIGLLVFLVNFFILPLYYNQKEIKFLSYYLFTVSIISNIFLLLAEASIYLINLT
jgi:hypothetical protein